MSDRPIPKRQRVAKACDSCRSLKSKCDGVQPVCGRCLGYGHTCIWSDGSRKHHDDSDANRTADAYGQDHVQKMKKAIQAYDKLIKDVRANLPESDCAAIDLTLSYIKLHLLPKDVFEDRPPPKHQPAPSQPQYPSNEIILERIKTSQRYLGEASDIKFLHELRQVLGEEKADDANLDMETYEQEESHRTVINRNALKLPPKPLADSYLSIYFTTIHIAYPFVCEPLFRERYEKLYATNSGGDLDPSWLVLLYSLFGIGAYYTSFSQTTPNNLHFEYYSQAVEFDAKAVDVRSLDHINSLIARCFFLLATCQTGKCWITLGTAARIAQSIGLHVKELRWRAMPFRGNIKDEMRRRTWYSIYVLDRLLALQLGRPPAIHPDDYNVDLPARVDDLCFDYGADLVPDPPRADSCCVGDYFLAVINFSHIIYHAIHEIYSPSKILKIGSGFRRTTREIDDELQHWRNNLHRTLRFDLSHTFDKSLMFRTQRNNLAIKYHHLRALVYRPYLYLSDKRRGESDPQDLEGDSIERLQRACIGEAQSTARLLHSLPDEKSLVQGFPWWQMVSCLLTACSILIISDRIVETLPDSRDMDRSTVEEDANTCLQVFDALSNNSQAARVAGNMMKNLRTNVMKMRKAKSPHTSQVLRLKQEEAARPGSNEYSNGPAASMTPVYQNPLLENPAEGGSMYGTPAPSAPVFTDGFPTMPFDYNADDPNNFIDLQQWRNQLSSSLMWTENFIDGTQQQPDFYTASYGL